MDARHAGPLGSDRASFGDLLRQARTAAALSQEELAERAGLSARGISALERGIRRAPRLATVRMLADALKLDDTGRASLIDAARPALGVASTAAPQLVSLPSPSTRLVGREREVAAVSEVLRDGEVRLLTLTGAGGSGKTRLAIAVAGRLAAAFPDGVAFVDFAPLTDPTLVPPAVAQAFGLKDPRGIGPEVVVRAYLTNRRVLLVLDNFEHLLDAAPFVARLLGSAPNVRVVATSREPLRLRGEREFVVPPLALPDLASGADLTRLGECEAVALFVERARDARGDFRLTAENAAAVADICRRLDGLPLALELAAARIRVLPPEGLLLRLGQVLPILTGGARDAPARQRTLRDTIAWSYDLLNERERRLFRSLGCFGGGWTLDAAEAIAPTNEGQDVFETLISLVEKNLVRVDGGTDEPRYAMLETIREFALRQLAASGEELSARDRHVAWCQSLAEASEPALEGYGGEQKIWLARLDLELGNVRTALAWLHQIGDARRLLRLLTVLDTYWFLRPYREEVNRWLATGLRAPDVPADIREAVLHVAVSFALLQGDVPKAMDYSNQHVAVAEAWGNPFALGRAHFDLGQVWSLSGDVARAAASYHRAVTLFQQAGAESWIYLALAELGSARLLGGDIAGAVHLLDEALALVRQTDETDPLALQDRFALAGILGLRAYAARAQGDLLLATHLFGEQLAIAQEVSIRREELGALAGFAGIACDRCQPERAARLLGAVDAAREADGQAHIPDFLHVKRVKDATCSALGEAAFNANWHEGRAMPFEEAVTEALALVDEVTG
jgi:predicted ATPase/DNA-binding XRE family transcriptional regulator